jgi:hypothetical protein
MNFLDTGIFDERTFSFSGNELFRKHYFYYQLSIFLHINFIIIEGYDTNSYTLNLTLFHCFTYNIFVIHLRMSNFINKSNCLKLDSLLFNEVFDRNQLLYCMIKNVLAFQKEHKIINFLFFDKYAMKQMEYIYHIIFSIYGV